MTFFPVIAFFLVYFRLRVYNVFTIEKVYAIVKNRGSEQIVREKGEEIA